MRSAIRGGTGRSWRTLLALAVLAGCSGDGPSDPSNPDLLIAVAAGNNQNGTVGAALPAVVQVLVTDLLGRPASGKVVNFAVLTGGGTTTNTTTTDGSGLASATWQLGTVALSVQSLEARILTPAGVRKSIVFAATANADAPDTIVVTTAGGLSAAAGHPVRVIPSVRLADQFGNPVPNHTVNFTVTQGGGVVVGGAVATDSTGTAMVGGWTMGQNEGINTLAAAAEGLPSTVTFQANGTSPVPSNISLLTQPSGGLVSGEVFAQQPVAQIVNDSNDPIHQPGLQISAAIATGGGGAIIGTPTMTSDSSGMASFAGLGLAGLVGSYTLEFAGGTLVPDTSIAIGLSAGPATTMALSAGDTQSVNAGSAVPIAPAVTITDDWGNGKSGITVTFEAAPGSGSVVGGTAVTGPTGLATVGSWVLSPGSGPNSLTATAEAAGLSGNPATFAATALGNFWSSRSSMPLPLRFTAWGTYQNLLFTAGGRDGALTVHDTMQVYNPAANSWSGRKSMNSERVGASAGFIQGKFYVTGGNPQGGQPVTSTEVYNPINNTWVFVADLPGARNFSGFTVMNDKLYLAAGGDSNGQIPTTVVYDPVTNQWDSLANLPAERNDAVAVNHNGLIYLIGGQVQNTIDGALLVYDPLADTWAPLAPMPTPRYHANAEVLNGKIYVISGLTQGGVASPVVEVYDIASNTWDAATPIPTARSAAAIAVVDGVIYVAGGSANNTVTGVVEAYVP